MKSIGEIISTRRKSKKLSQNALADMLTEQGSKTTQKSISKWETDVNEPSVTDFLTLCKLLDITDIYGEYFGDNPSDSMSELNDEGKEKVLDYIKLLVASGLYKKKAAEIIPFRRVIKLYDTPVSAGVGNFLEESEYISIEVGSEVSPAADFGVRISGDSMEPQYINGQYAYVHSQQFLEDGEIGIFYFDGNVYIKKFHNNNNECMLISLNPKYHPIIITENSSFKILGKVVS